MKNIKIPLLIILTVALLLRIGFIIFYDNGKMLLNNHYAADEYSYDQIAINFLNGKGLVTDDGLYARRAPLYPLFLAIIYYIFGYSLVSVRFVQAVIGSLTCIVVYLIGKEQFNKKVGLISALISAIYYPFISQPAYLLTEVLFTFLLTLSILFLIKYYNFKKVNNLFIGSISIGLTALCRAVILYFVIFIVIYVTLSAKPNIGRIARSISIVLLGVLVVVAPWTIRNYRIYKSFIPISLESGVALYLGNNPLATGGTGGNSIYGRDQFLPKNIKELYTAESNKILENLAIRYIINNPKRILMLALKKFVNMWRPFYADARLINKFVMSFFYIPVVLLAIAGMVKTLFVNPKKYILLYGLVFYFVIAHMITVSEIRYRYPVMPILVIFSADCLIFFIDKIRSRREGRYIV